MSALKKLKLVVIMHALMIALCACHNTSEAKKAPAASDSKAIRETPMDTSTLSAQDPTKHGLDY